MHRNVRWMHVAGEILTRLFECPADAIVTFAGFDPATKKTVLFIESEEFAPVDVNDIPPEMVAKLRMKQWESAVTRVSDEHVNVTIYQQDKVTSADFYGETAMQQAEIYQMGQRQKAGF